MGALTGLKILDFSTLLPGPYATLMLADLGAEVLKISSPTRGDIVANYPPFIKGSNLSANQAWLGRNKKNMFLNLKSEEGKNIVKKLILEYDVLLEQFRPGVMKKLGLDYETLQKINPKLIYCSLTGYGQSGPMKNNAGHDINYLARSGNMSYSGRKSTGPVLTNMQIADVGVGSLHSVVGILAAVNYRNTTGEGQYIDISMLDGLIPFHAMEGASFLATGIESKREETRLNGGDIYDFYETKDDRYLSVGALEPKFWRNFCECIKLPQLIEKEITSENILETKEIIRIRLKEKTLSEWMDVFKGKDVCVEPVLNMKEALIEDSQIKAREMVVEVNIPNDNDLKIKQMGSPIKLSKCPVEYSKSGYPLGYHTKEVLLKLGYSEDEIKQLLKDEII